ncbi:MAG: radical SAM protein [Candidatus Micrarchaeota archaeon]|nr:radical SAM protein [Candidatus Micrarchaeota archaeon]
MKQAINGLIITTVCENNCDHCGSSPQRIRKHMGRDVIEAAKAFGRFHEGIGLHGGNPLLWRGEKGERIGDLALELKEKGVKKFSTTIAPLSENDADGIEGFKSLSKVAGGVRIAVSFNPFMRDANGTKVSLDEMAERFKFTVRLALEIKIGGLQHMIRYTPSTKMETLEKFPLPLMEAPAQGKQSLVWPVGRARGIWIEEARGLPPEMNRMLRAREDVCSWDGRNFFVVSDGLLVPGCENIVCTRLGLPVSIFDDPERIEKKMTEEPERTKGLKGKFFLPACELHARMGRKEGWNK